MIGCVCYPGTEHSDGCPEGRFPMITGKQERMEMSRKEVELLIAIEPVLRRLGLSLYCIRCHATGQPDGIRANNAPTDNELVVECGCMTRRYKNLV